MGTFGAHNGTWGIFTDVVYLHFGGDSANSRQFTIGNIGLPADASASLNWDLKGSVWTVAGEYRVASAPSWTLDVLGGTRLFDMHEKLDWAISGSIGPLDPLARSGSASLSQSTFDVIVGAKGRYAFGAERAWSVPFYVDIGTGQSHSTYQAAAGLAYAFKWGEITAMYRYLGYSMKSGKAFDEIHFAGPARRRDISLVVPPARRSARHASSSALRTQSRACAVLQPIGDCWCVAMRVHSRLLSGGPHG